MNQLNCLINQADCGRIPGNPVCPKCGMDERVVFPGQVDREAAQAIALTRYEATAEAAAGAVAEAAAKQAQVVQTQPSSGASTSLQEPSLDPRNTKSEPPPFRRSKSTSKRVVAVFLVVLFLGGAWWWKTAQDERVALAISRAEAAEKAAEMAAAKKNTFNAPIDGPQAGAQSLSGSKDKNISINPTPGGGSERQVLRKKTSTHVSSSSSDAIPINIYSSGVGVGNQDNIGLPSNSSSSSMDVKIIESILEYRVQESVHYSRDDAEQRVRELEALGFKFSVSEREVNNRPIFRLRSERFSTKEDAENLRSSMSSRGIDSVLVRIQK
jgi:hypothetical protein